MSLVMQKSNIVPFSERLKSALLLDKQTEWEACLLLDCSGSMNERYNGKSKYDYLQEAMREIPWKKLYFNSIIKNTPLYPCGGTNLESGILAVDSTFSKIILVSDGLPDNEEAAIRAAKVKGIPIETILIGDDPKGIEFMKRLSLLTGGKTSTNIKIEELSLLKGHLLALKG